MRALAESIQAAESAMAAHRTTAPLAARLRALQERLRTGRFHLAVLGQFKRGKSTLLNALLGEPFLPVAIVPLTSIPTLIEYGPARAVEVLFHDGRREAIGPDAIGRYVTETANPGNRLAVARVEVRHPASILQRGVVLIDTPGIGSTYTHNTEVTLGFLSEVDAALFLISADPPLTAVELEFLQAVRQRMDRLFFVLNKVDYLSPAEQDEALRFLQRTLRERADLSPDVPLFPVSARLALEARQRGDAESWQASGMAAVEQVLHRFGREEKVATLRQAIRAKAAGLVREALELLHAERRALTMPLEELHESRRLFQDTLAEARRERQRAAALLGADQSQILAAINERASELREEAQAYLQGRLDEVLNQAVGARGAEALARQTLAKTVAEFFTARYEPFSAAAHDEVTALLGSHARQASDLASQVRRVAAGLFEFDASPLAPGELPARLRGPAWDVSPWLGGLSIPFSGDLWARLLPASRKLTRLQARLRPVVEKLATHNAEQIRWATVQNVAETFRLFQVRLDSRWSETIEALSEAIELAAIRREERHEEAAGLIAQVNDNIERLQQVAAELAAEAADE